MPSALPLITIRRSREQRSDNGVNIQIVITNIAGLPRELDLSELRANVSLISSIYVSEPQATNGELSFSIDMAAAQFGRRMAKQIVVSIVKMVPDVIVQVLNLATGSPYYIVAIHIKGRFLVFDSPNVVKLIDLTRYINGLMLRAEVDAIFAQLDLNRDE